MTVTRSGGRLAAASTLPALAAAIVLTACSGTAGHPDSGSAASAPTGQSQIAPSSPVTVTQPAPSPTPTSPQPVTSPVSQPLAAPGPCATTALRLAIGPANGAAGSIYYPIQLTNVSTSTCTLYGYPGVAFSTGAGGSVIGGSAVRNPTFPKKLVTLAPGAIAHASLQVAIAANYPAQTCKPTTAHWLQVYPPNQFAALYVPFTAQTCTGHIPGGSTLGIYVVRPGATGP